METAIVILATGDYWKGAKVLIHTLRKYGNLPTYVTPIVLGIDKCYFARPASITEDYSGIKVAAGQFAQVAKKFFALTLPYDRIILMDADMLCVGDCSYLWSGVSGKLPFYACRDTASYIYYKKVIDEIGLNPNRVFNAGTMVFQMPFDLKLFLLEASHGILQAYDGGDQGYLNHYFQYHGIETGFLPPEYNCCLDVNMPQVPDHAKRLIHFCGGNANPWNRQEIYDNDWRVPYYQRWDEAWEECNAQEECNK
jgi:lipopolysaccharide biosynthesis glycosyltransferase